MPNTLPFQFKRLNPSPYAAQQAAIEEYLARVAAQEPQEPNPQRGASYYDKMAGGPIEVPYDPYEAPQMTARRKAIEETWRSGKDAPEWSTEVSAMFPVSAATKRPAPDVGYGKEYNYSALDPGYVPPAATPTGSSVPTNTDLGIPDRVPSPADLAPLMVTRKNGRPTERVLGDGSDLDKARARRRELQTYEPQKSHGLRRLAPLPEGLARGAKYGPWGTLGGGAVAALMALLNPKYADEKWKEKQLAQTGETIQGLEGEQTQGIENQIRQAQLNEIQNPLKKPRPTSYRVLTQDEGNLKKGTKVGREFDEKTGQWVDTGTVLDLPEEERADNKISGVTRIVAEGEYEGIPAGTEIRLMPDGSDVVREGKPLIAKVAPTEKQPKDSADYATRANWYYKKQGEADATAKSLKKQADLIVPQAGYDLTADQKANKEDLLRRAAKAEEDARSYRDKGDEAATMLKSLAPKTGTVKPAKDGKYHYTPDQIRGSLQPGQTYEEIYAKLKANPKVKIDE
jgi:hypothetical protein